MPRYLYECPEHGAFDVFKDMSECSRAETCECGLDAERVWTAPQVVMLDGQWEFTHMGANNSKGRRTPDQQEAAEGKVVNHMRKLAHQKQRSAALERNGMKLKGTIPRALYQARQRQTGDKSYWLHEGDRALRREGLHFGD